MSVKDPQAPHCLRRLAVRVYGGPFRRDGHILSIPLYGLERLPQFLTEAGAR